jgi:hypothetical protein
MASINRWSSHILFFPRLSIPKRHAQRTKAYATIGHRSDRDHRDDLAMPSCSPLVATEKRLWMPFARAKSWQDKRAARQDLEQPRTVLRCVRCFIVYVENGSARGFHVARSCSAGKST